MPVDVFVIDRGMSFPVESAPYAVLVRDRWNDYGYVTMFDLFLIDERGVYSNIGNVKIATVGQVVPALGYSEVFLEEHFSQLGGQYVSLGQDYSYYEMLSTMPTDLYADLLGTLQDAVWLPHKVEQFRRQDVWTTSLLRFDSAAVALKDAGQMLLFSQRSESLEVGQLIFRTSVGPGNKFDLHLRFSDQRYLTSKINAIIGYNGSGKTGVLANLAMATHADSSSRVKRSFVDEHGRFLGQDPQFSATIMVSYSAFDTFTLPQALGDDERAIVDKKGAVFGYSYCGLRALTTSEGKSFERHKTNSELRNEFVFGLSQIRALNRSDVLARCLAVLGIEPSFSRVTNLGRLMDVALDNSGRFFDDLSTGHKITLSIIVHLVLRLQPRSLVLIDEPEAHLHPSLLAALLKTLTALLDEFKSYSVVATHSPVVLQEIPACCVTVLRRAGLNTSVQHPQIETFGENIGAITSSVFHMDGSATDFHAKLDDLAREYSESEADSRFPAGMSAAARSYFLSRKRII